MTIGCRSCLYVKFYTLKTKGSSCEVLGFVYFSVFFCVAFAQKKYQTHSFALSGSWEEAERQIPNFHAFFNVLHGNTKIFLKKDFTLSQCLNIFFRTFLILELWTKSKFGSFWYFKFLNHSIFFGLLSTFRQIFFGIYSTIFE